jgi:hypothetical protein
MQERELTELIEKGIKLNTAPVGGSLADSLRAIPMSTKEVTQESQLTVWAIAASLLAIISLNIYIISSAQSNQSILDTYLDFKTMHL